MRKCDFNFHSEFFLGKGVVKICSKFSGEHPCFGMGILFLNLLHIFRTPFHKNTSECLLLYPACHVYEH